MATILSYVDGATLGLRRGHYPLVVRYGGRTWLLDEPIWNDPDDITGCTYIAQSATLADDKDEFQLCVMNGAPDRES